MPAYPGSNQAAIIKCNTQQYFYNNEAITAGKTSVAYQLERPRDAYPWGFAVQIGFSGSPGTFEVDVQFAEWDLDTCYVSVGTITAVNASNVGRYDAPGGTVFPKYVRLIHKTFPNVVNTTATLTR